MHKNFLVLFLSLITLSFPADSKADSAAELNRRFLEAEKCAAALRQKPHAMKYRDKWEQCIEKYEGVYRRNPEGAWAPASLYNSGRLYLELFKHSRNPSDRKNGMELLSQVEKFSESKYREPSSEELQKIQTAARLQDAYLEDPERPLSAQALCLEAGFYIGLQKGLKFSSDQRAARENFERIVEDFPNSPFAKKAAEELKANG